MSMKITKKSPFSGIEHTRELEVTPEEMDRWRSGELIQNVFPHLSADEREFLMTGIMPDEWDAMFAEPEVDLDDDGSF